MIYLKKIIFIFVLFSLSFTNIVQANINCCSHESKIEIVDNKSLENENNCHKFSENQDVKKQNSCSKCGINVAFYEFSKVICNTRYFGNNNQYISSNLKFLSQYQNLIYSPPKITS